MRYSATEEELLQSLSNAHNSPAQGNVLKYRLQLDYWALNIRNSFCQGKLRIPVSETIFILVNFLFQFTAKWILHHPVAQITLSYLH